MFQDWSRDWNFSFFQNAQKHRDCIQNKGHNPADMNLI